MLCVDVSAVQIYIVHRGVNQTCSHLLPRQEEATSVNGE